jgi:hypothetical protein
MYIKTLNGNLVMRDKNQLCPHLNITIRLRCFSVTFELQSFFFLPMLLSISAASSGVALGMTPGSLKLVRSNAESTKINKSPPITGIAGVILSARNGQLESRNV